jgi:hypothetical protein
MGLGFRTLRKRQRAHFKMKKLLTHDEIHRLAALGAFLNLKQLSIVTGFCYSTVHKWRREGLPLIDGKITLADALAWLKAKPQQVSLQDVGIREHPLHPDAGRFCALTRRNG